MKVKELKKLVDFLAEQHPENEVLFSVSDYYSGLEFDATVRARYEKGRNFYSSVWTNIDTNTTRITVDLKEKKEFDGTIKQPKITFRKL